MQVKQLGFQGEFCLDPNQIELFHIWFTLKEQAIKCAKKVNQVFEKAETEGAAEIQLDSRFIDYPMVQDDRGIVSLPNLIGIYEK